MGPARIDEMADAFVADRAALIGKLRADGLQQAGQIDPLGALGRSVTA